MTVTSRRTRRCADWSHWRRAAGRLRQSTRRPRARVAWTMTRAGAGMAGIAISRWSCARRAFWRASAGRPPLRRAFPPSGARPSFPAVHRQVLVWLFQDVVLWLIATNQIAQFRPRRIERSSTRFRCETPWNSYAYAMVDWMARAHPSLGATWLALPPSPGRSPADCGRSRPSRPSVPFRPCHDTGTGLACGGVSSR
jgi:hypothetical protein